MATANIIDQRTANLGLPLPNVKNNQADDCPRIAESITKIDAQIGSIRENMRAVTEKVNETLGATLESIDSRLETMRGELEEVAASASNLGAILGGGMEVDADGFLTLETDDETGGDIAWSISGDGYLEAVLNEQTASAA